MENAWSRIQPSSRSARILLAILFAIPAISCLVLACLSPYTSYSHDFGIPGFVFVALPVFGSIFLWKWRRKSFSVGLLACWIWFSFVQFAAQYSAPLWYHADSWGYTFAFEQSLPVAGITGALFFLVALLLGRVAFEPGGSITNRDAIIIRIIVIGCLGIIVMLTAVFIHVRLDHERIWKDREVMKEMTPEKLIANCGPPTSDEQTDFLNLHTLFTRVLTYKRSDNWAKLEFKRDASSPWHLTHFTSPAMDISPSDEDSYLAIRQLPCMAK